jgi:hypothetical protein
VHEFVCGGVETRSLLLLKPKKRGVSMPEPLLDALMITLITPAVYTFTSVFPLTSAFVFATILYKN